MERELACHPPKLSEQVAPSLRPHPSQVLDQCEARAEVVVRSGESVTGEVIAREKAAQLCCDHEGADQYAVEVLADGLIEPRFLVRRIAHGEIPVLYAAPG